MIKAIEEAKELRKTFDRIYRDGISKRAHQLMSEYIKKYPKGNYREACELLGRFRALYIAIPTHEYWREVADRGYEKERYDIRSFDPKIEEIER